MAIVTEFYEKFREGESLEAKYTPEVIIFDEEGEVDAFAAEFVIDQVAKKEDSVLTLPTGNTPLGMYENLVQAYNFGQVDFSNVTAFNLDEYYPMDPNSEDSYYSYMRKNLFDHVPVKEWHILNGGADDPEKEAQRYADLLSVHQPIDLAILGLGPKTTCHLAFNERGSQVDSRTRFVTLDPETIGVNSQLFVNPNEIRTGALTQGIADILDAEKILLLAKGVGKAWGVNRTLKGPVSSDAPSSYLRLHPNVTIALDKAAASYL